MNKQDDIMIYLKEKFPEAICELDYNTDYELLIAIALSAQTTDAIVNKVTKTLFSKYDSAKALSLANRSDIEEIIRPIGFSYKKSEFVIDIASSFSNGFDSTNREELEKIKGVGKKTASVFLSEYHGIETFAVDTHVHRISIRLGICKRDANVVECEKALKLFFNKENWNEVNLRMVLFGRYYCKSRKPLCEDCKLQKYCNYFKSL